MAPHNIDEWAALFTIMSIAIGGLIGLVNIWVIRPLKDMMSNLSDKFGTLNETLKIMQKDVDSISDQVQKHEKDIYGLQIKVENIEVE
ncbi:hypothetical protein LNP00_04210 [Fructobacillus sp. M158]|uniref:hypothetical protein n=1 Tax=Fructobacillus parabroussonetiae TaxID=2713174 RepID=UPI00200B2CE1|nr:hypothetical protein [Fructobacillus parabroussonetiae]MCK8617567.1 hypothetical protein [Fructobacillus parabroussonetiae]